MHPTTKNFKLFRDGRTTWSRFPVALLTVAVLFSMMIGCGNKHADPGNGRNHGPGYSGMALLRDNRFVTVYDTKYKKNMKKNQPRVGMVKVEPVENGDILVDESDIKVDWGTGRPSNDLEAICNIPGKENQFLLAESGDKTRYGIEGKIFHLRVFKKKGKKKWRATF